MALYSMNRYSRAPRREIVESADYQQQFQKEFSRLKSLCIPETQRAYHTLHGLSAPSINRSPFSEIESAKIDAR